MLKTHNGRGGSVSTDNFYASDMTVSDYDYYN